MAAADRTSRQAQADALRQEVLDCRRKQEDHRRTARTLEEQTNALAAFTTDRPPMSPASKARICKSIASLLDEPYRQEASRLGPMIDALKRALAAYDVDGVARVLKEISEVVLQVKDDRAGSAEMMACMIGVENGDYWAVLAQEGWEVAGASGDGREG